MLIYKVFAQAAEAGWLRHCIARSSRAPACVWCRSQLVVGTRDGFGSPRYLACGPKTYFVVPVGKDKIILLYRAAKIGSVI